MKVSILLCLSVLIIISVFAQVKPNLRQTVKPPAGKAKVWLFLLAGQSNMAGRGPVEPQDTLSNSHVLTLNKNGEWELAKDPIHFDKEIAAVGPGLTFGKTMAAAYNDVYIGLIPCAVGGSAIDSWLPGTGKNYGAAIERCKIALKAGTFKGIIWHQGETDCTEKGVLTYREKLADVINGFRRDLNLPNLPFVAGELPAFQEQQPDKDKKLQFNPYVKQVNAIIAGLKGQVTNYDFVSADGTQHKGDHLHFDTRSARLMGERYAEKMEMLIKKP